MGCSYILTCLDSDLPSLTEVIGKTMLASRSTALQFLFYVCPKARDIEVVCMSLRTRLSDWLFNDW